MKDLAPPTPLSWGFFGTVIVVFLALKALVQWRTGKGFDLSRTLPIVTVIAGGVTILGLLGFYAAAKMGWVWLYGVPFVVLFYLMLFGGPVVQALFAINILVLGDEVASKRRRTHRILLLVLSVSSCLVWYGIEKALFHGSGR